MEQTSLDPVAITLRHLEYDLEYLDRFKEQPCWYTYEYKFYAISYGIAKLQSMKNCIPDKHKERHGKLLSKYLVAHQTIL